jgi:ribosome-associated toxin RatA of RatAB toxin-antitoxin module
MISAARTKALPLLMLTAWVGVALAAEQVSVEASRQGTAIAIRARATIKAPYALIWRTLTDYDHLSEFIPGMITSHVIERRGGAAIVEQTGEAGFLFFTYPIDVVVESREEPPGFIGMRVLKGNLKQIDGGYRIEEISGKDDEYVLRWSGIVERPTLLPLFITVPLMRANIADQFRGMVNEIDRREALRTGKREGTRPFIS